MREIRTPCGRSVLRRAGDQPERPQPGLGDGPVGQFVEGEREGEGALLPGDRHPQDPAVRAGRPRLDTGTGAEAGAVQRALDGHPVPVEGHRPGLGMRCAEPAAHGELTIEGRVRDPDRDPPAPRYLVDEQPQIPDAGLDGHRLAVLRAGLPQIDVPAALSGLQGARQHRAQPPVAQRAQLQPYGVAVALALGAAQPEQQFGRLLVLAAAEVEIEGDPAARSRGAVGPRCPSPCGDGHAVFPLRITAAAL